MSELVPERSKIFKSENGFSNLIAWFDDLGQRIHRRPLALMDTHSPQILRVNSGETIPNKSNKLTKRIFQLDDLDAGALALRMNMCGSVAESRNRN